MGSKGRVPPHVRRPLPGPGVVHPEPFAPGVLPPPGPFPPFDMLPPPEVLEQKLAAQHVEIQRLASENHRLAATHGTLRQELAAAQHELQILHTHIGVIKSEGEQHMRGLVDRIAKMETELKAADSLKLDLQQARTEAEKLVVSRQELVSKVHQLTQDLRRAHTDVQQIPMLMSELESLRQEYQRCRVSYDYEKKLFSDHLESLQAMEKNYVTMAREVEKLHLELNNTANTAAGGSYGGALGNNEKEVSGRPVGQNMYEDGYGIPQGQGHAAVSASNAGAATNASTAAGAVTTTAGAVTPTYAGAQSGSLPTKSAYDASRAPGYDAQRGPNYDAQRGSGYDMSRMPSYDAQRMPGYDAQGHSGYDASRGPGYDMYRGSHYDVSRGAGYDAMSRGTAGLHGQLPPTMPYGSGTPPTRPGGGYQASARGGNPARR